MVSQNILKIKLFCTTLFIQFVSLIIFFSCTTVASAGDSQRGKEIAKPCSVCHGDNGIAKMIEAPNLAGQSEIYLAEQLRHYRSGQRTHEVMNLMAKPLTNNDIEDLSAWFSSIACQVRQ